MMDGEYIIDDFFADLYKLSEELENLKEQEEEQ